MMRVSNHHGHDVVNIHELRLRAPKQRSVSHELAATLLSLSARLVSSFISFVKNNNSFYTHLQMDKLNFGQ